MGKKKKKKEEEEEENYPNILPDIGKPLRSETGPFEGVRHHQVVQKGSVLLPDLVLFIDQLLLDSVVMFSGCGKMLGRK